MGGWLLCGGGALWVDRCSVYGSDVVCGGGCSVAVLAETQLTDAAETAKILYQTHRADLFGMLQDCYHGRSLARIGLGADLKFCAQTDIVDVVPSLIDGRIIA